MGAQYPDMVDAILPFCASAKTSPHNIVFLEGVKAALEADGAFAGGDYRSPPEVGLKALRGCTRAGPTRRPSTGSACTASSASRPSRMCSSTGNRITLDWDANDLLAKLRTWQAGDISAGPCLPG